MPFGPEIMMMLVLLLGQTGGDMLDIISTDAYWRNKHVTVTVEQLRRDAGADADLASVDALTKDLASEDYKVREKARQKLLEMGPGIIEKLKPVTESTDNEVATVAQQIVQQLTAVAQSRANRRLMAIRTLGERKDRDSIDLLKSLLKSPDPLVPDYARRALAQIDGKPFVPLFDDSAYSADLMALPAHSTIAAQVRTTVLGKPLNVDTFIDEFLKSAKDQLDSLPALPPAADGTVAATPKLPSREKLIDRFTTQWLSALDGIGDMRIDAVSVGITTDDVPANNGVAILLRGKYNPHALLEFAKASNLKDNLHLNFHTVAGVEAIDSPDDSSALLISPDRLLLIIGNEGHAAIAEGIIQRLGKEPPKEATEQALDKSERLAPILKLVDRRAVAWACGIIPKDMQKDDTLKGFETFTAHALREKDALRFVVKAEGPDEEKVKASVVAFNDGLKQMHEEIKREIAHRKSLTAVLAMLDSLKCTSDGKAGTLSGVATSGVFLSMLQEGGMFMLDEMEEDKETPPNHVPLDERQPVPPAPEPVPEPPVHAPEE